jgi:hypothetical protein
MEMMPYHPTPDHARLEDRVPSAPLTFGPTGPAVDAHLETTDWRQGLPVLNGLGLTLRELQMAMRPACSSD